jgi:hypothetical protein
MILQRQREQPFWSLHEAALWTADMLELLLAKRKEAVDAGEIAQSERWNMQFRFIRCFAIHAFIEFGHDRQIEALRRYARTLAEELS